MSFATLNLYPVNGPYYGCERLLEELDALSGAGKIFLTFCEYENQRYELTTSEPKVQLDISQYSEWGRNFLCHLIETEFQRSETDGRTVLSVCPNGDERKYLKQYWVSRTAGNDGRIIYHLSALRR